MIIAAAILTHVGIQPDDMNGFDMRAFIPSRRNADLTGYAAINFDPIDAGNQDIAAQ